jgi:hypothetical protein
MGVLPQASGAFLSPLSSLFDFAKNSNFSLNAPAQFQRIFRRSETIVKCKWTKFCGSGPRLPATCREVAQSNPVK